MSLSTLKHIIYSSLIVSETSGSAILVDEAKLNIMQVTYITLQSKFEKNDDEIMGQEVFRSLFNEYHKKVMPQF